MACEIGSVYTGGRAAYPNDIVSSRTSLVSNQQATESVQKLNVKRGIECQHTTDTHARLHKPVEMNTCRWGYPNYQEQVEAKEHMFCKPCTQGSSALFAWRTSMHLDIISLCFAQVFWMTFLFLLYSVCRSDSSLVQAAMGRFYCPGGTRRYPCRLYSASGSDANGNPDATPCKCTFGEESGGPGLSSGCKSPSR